MPRRLDSVGYGVTIPATTARVVDTAVEIFGDPDPDELAFLHSILAQTFLPYRDPKTRDYVRESGRATLVLTAGYLLDPKTRKPVLQGLPHGTTQARWRLLDKAQENIRGTENFHLPGIRDAVVQCRTGTAFGISSL